MEIPDIAAWTQVGFGDLLAAFRKAKADCFFERSAYVAEQFAEYEQDLFEHLRELLQRLHAGDVDTVFREAQTRPPSVFAKGLRVELRKSEPAAHAFFSDSDRAFERLKADAKAIEPQFRLVGDFDVPMHILSGLWINLVGHKYDAQLTSHAFGSRVRRHGRATVLDRPKGYYQYEAVGSFEPYFQPYRRWRDLGMAAIGRAIDAGDAVVALTLDFSSYYHNIDPSFMVDQEFLATIGLELSRWELEFTSSLVRALKAWGLRAAAMFEPDDANQASHGGLPIGLSAVRIITNVLLHQFDEGIIGSLYPVYYGRYVDDVFLVIRDSGRLKSTEDLWDHLQTSAPFFRRVESNAAPGEVDVDLGSYQGETRLRLEPTKQRVFFLKGQAGRDLLSNIAHQVRTLSSERRLMPLIDEMDASASARALAAATNAAEEPDVLRRADGLTLRRLGWALQLRSAEILARDLKPSAWIDKRKSFYDFACGHILRPDKILEHVDYLARLISLAVSLADWGHALRMYQRATGAIEALESAVKGKTCRINGVGTTASDQVWSGFRQWVANACREAILRSLPWDSRVGESYRLTREARKVLRLVGVDPGEAVERALRLREADLAKRSYKEHLRWDAQDERARIPGEEELPQVLSQRSDERYQDLYRFLHSTRGEEEMTGVRRVNPRCEHDNGEDVSLLPYLLATRPYTAQEVALYCPRECVFQPRGAALERWGAYTHAVRGAWRAPSEESDLDEPAALSLPGDNDPAGIVDLSERDDRPIIHLGITSLKTTAHSWAAAAAGRSDRSPSRYARLATIVNLAIKADPRPSHLILPELSIPECWLETIASILLEAGISLIAGLDYEHYDVNEIGSSAALILRDDRLGFASSIQIRQPKLVAAPGEEEDLWRSYGKRWRQWQANRSHPVYVHQGLHLGVLVCSELQNIRHRERFQGAVDLLTVLSWNKDIETFSSLVQSASLDVHAYIALVNNRTYGDSRVRSPRREAHERDVCQVRGGENDQLVVVKIDPTDLRAQQSRATRWKKAGDKYKPAPEGFKISSGRRSTPS